MREYNNQDVKINETELDPCIAAEIRMKKALFSQRTRRNLLILSVFIVTLILFSVLLLFLFSRMPPSESTEHLTDSFPETNPGPHDAFNDPTLITSSSSTETVIDSTKLSKAETDENVFLQNTGNTMDTSDFSSTSTVLSSKSIVQTHPLWEQQSAVFIDSTTKVTSSPTTVDMRREETVTLPFFISDDDGEAQNCKSLLNEGKTESGIYQISLPKFGKFDVLCDMKTNGGGWTVIQKRQNDQVYFANRTWKEYENGFGELTTSFWLGLNKIHALSAKDNAHPVTLRIELRGDFCEDRNGCSQQPNGYWWGEWDFNIGDASQKYSLSISPALAGNLSERTATDRFYYMNNGKSFTTIDQDNDKFQGNCAQFRDFGGWWHNDCGYVALNGRYGDRSSKMRNLFWFYGSGTRPFINYYIKPKETEMKLRSKS
uniref:Fibrinogen C-terminal domain-containing protein n=1 Tax=Setaria digitata TaxID=48799 RepID=A0A915PTU8_9BILA